MRLPARYQIGRILAATVDVFVTAKRANYFNQPPAAIACTPLIQLKVSHWWDQLAQGNRQIVYANLSIFPLYN